MITKGKMQKTTELFLRSISAIYFVAFLSLYFQIPGLYGKNGILPAHTQVSNLDSLSECLQESKALLCFAPKLGLSIDYMMDLISIIGLVLSFCGFILLSFCNSFTFLILWICYYSLHQVGQTFLWFQWDSLLLEVGFLTILVAPLFEKSDVTSPKDMVTMWLIKWALFRLMFASGVVKLQSGCPAWWSLSALDSHYQSQCIPTSVAWYAHQFPGWFHKICVVATYVIEIAVPFFFFSPIRDHRIFAFYAQFIFQTIIICTGNYNFFNLLTMVMCLPLLDDKHLGYISGRKIRSKYQIIASVIFKWIGFAVLLYYTLAYFSIRLTTQSTIESSIEFTRPGFDSWMHTIVPVTTVVGAVSLLLTIADALTGAVFVQRSKQIKIQTFITTLLYSLLAVGLFGISLVPYSVLDPPSRENIWPVFKQLHSVTGDYHIASSYGLFRRMTGVGGRPEVILEGSDSVSGPWIEYDFKYKPGPLDRKPTFIAPHQPRLDWQMWFAALGSYNQNPWLVSLSYRLLQGQAEVLDLLHPNTPWKNKPPKYIRALRYTYHFTPEKSTNGHWWRRSEREEYMPMYEVTHPPLLEYLRKQRFIGVSGSETQGGLLSYFLQAVRSAFRNGYPEIFIWVSLAIGFATLLFNKYMA